MVGRWLVAIVAPHVLIRLDLAIASTFCSVATCEALSSVPSHSATCTNCHLFDSAILAVMAPEKVAPKRSPRAWDALRPALPQWILDAVQALGFSQMTPVQAATMPHFMGNKDVVVEVSLLVF